MSPSTVVVDGPLEANLSGKNRASDLLSGAERTLPFSGVLHIENVSEGLVRNVANPGKADCQNAPRTSSTVVEHFEVPAEDLTPDYLHSFKPKVGINAQVLSLSRDKKSLSAVAEEPSIGPPPDGVVYEVVYTTQTTHPTPACGFNDVGVPNPANYSVEARRYHQYLNGVQVAEWMDTVETFASCSSGP
jgi:hypothetical protein